MNREKISACIITFNEEKKIRRCLESVAWCDEIILLDSFSTDNTVKICYEYTDKVYQRSWGGYIQARNNIRDLATNPWVLFLDADEEVSETMKNEILSELEDPGSCVGYQFPRQVFYLGRWIKHGEWYPDLKLRCFLKEKGVSGGVEPHDTVIVDGPVKTMKGIIYHYTYDSITHHVNQVNRFSQISAEAKKKSGEHFRWYDFMIRPGFRFLKCCLLKGGLLDGRRGLLIAVISSFGVAIKYAKLWELEHEDKQAARPDQTVPKP
jgi:glycosyltransferase involved in cell wall biosynthesis